MVKNIPNKYTQKNLLDLLDRKLKDKYDFFYLPIDFKNKCNLGYSFINFTTPDCIATFYRDFAGKRWERFNSEKVATQRCKLTRQICEVTYARIQGRVGLMNHFRNSKLMYRPEKYRPLLFGADCEFGRPTPFPAGPALPEPPRYDARRA